MTADRTPELQDFVRVFFDEYRELVDGMAKGTKLVKDAPVPSDRIFDLLDKGRPEEAWPIVAALVAGAPDDEALGFVAAGALEDLIRYHHDRVGEQILRQARTDPKLRAALGMMWGWEDVPDPLRAEFLGLLRIDAGTDGQIPT